MAKQSRRQRERIKKMCLKKRAYVKERDVIAACLFANSKWLVKHFYYTCPECSNFHVTTKMQRGPNPAVDPAP